MWNSQVSALLAGATICIYDGNAGFARLDAAVALRRRTARSPSSAPARRSTRSCLKAGIEPGRDVDLSALRSLGSTGSPLSDDAYRWVYGHVEGRTSGSRRSPAAPTSRPRSVRVCRRCRCASARCSAAASARPCTRSTSTGRALVDEVGELVCTEPIPSMPLYFWNDPGDRRLIESYFDMYPGVWRHGDWIRFIPHDEDDGTRRSARSSTAARDATINRHGIRMGTAELYRAVEALPEVLDSLVVDLEYLGRESCMPLFVVLRDGHALDDALTSRINGEIRRALSARHVPNDIFAIASVPRTLSGKKLELPVKKLLMGSRSSASSTATRWRTRTASTGSWRSPPSGRSRPPEGDLRRRVLRDTDVATDASRDGDASWRR